MKKLAALGAMLLVGLGIVTGVAPSAYAYPELTCNLTVDHQVVNSGQSFTATGTAVGSGISWKMTFNGQTRTGSGATFTQTFKAPTVTSKKVLPLTATSTSSGVSGSCQHALNITVLPLGVTVSPPGGITLPNTGGPYLIVLIAGLVLVIGGGIVVQQSRKRRAGPPQQ